MIYLKGEDVAIVILETPNLEEIKKGRPAPQKPNRPHHKTHRVEFPKEPT